MSDLKDRKEEIEALVLRVQDSDQQAFSDLYDIFIDPIYRYVYYRVRTADAEDLVETVFLKVWENIKKYSGKHGHFSAWIFRIAHNLVVDYYRGKKDATVEELSEALPDVNREHRAISRAEKHFDQQILKKALSGLKKNYREMLIYKFINELSNEEIAEIMGKSKGSLRILQMRALRALRDEFKHMGVDYN